MESTFDINKRFWLKNLDNKDFNTMDEVRELVNILSKRLPSIEDEDEIESTECYIEEYLDIIKSKYEVKEEIKEDIKKHIQKIQDMNFKDIEGYQSRLESSEHLLEKYSIDLCYPGEKAKNILNEIENINDQGLWIFIDFGELWGFIGKESKQAYRMELLKRIE